MNLLAAHFNILRLSDAVTMLKERRIPARAVCITFDDGYANNYTVAYPILAARRIPATVFVASDYLDGGRMFNDTIIESMRAAPATFDLRDMALGSFHLKDGATRARAAEEIIRALKHREPTVRARCAEMIASRVGLPARSELMMTRDQVRSLHRAGVEIGAHTITHPILTKLSLEEARHEIVAGKSELEGIIGSPVRTFAFPNGKPVSDYDRRHVDIVAQAGFQAAVSTAWGAAHSESDFLQLPRIAPWARSPLRYALQVTSSYRRRQYPRV